MAIKTTLVDHPVCTDALAQIRDRDTPNALFRQNLERIGGLLIAEATKDLPTVDGTVETPLTTAPARRIAAGVDGQQGGCAQAGTPSWVTSR